VTIDDDADSSHALGIHFFADIGERSALGEMVERAKDYGMDNPSDANAVRQLRATCMRWLEERRLMQAIDAITAIPGTQPKAFDLPSDIANIISIHFGKDRLQLRSRNRTPQKGRSDSELSSTAALSTMMNSDRAAIGKRVLLIDDLYRSGNTMMAGTRALRRAGATRVHCLALTKTARHCNGLPASVDNWPDEMPETLEVEDFDLPFC